VTQRNKRENIREELERAQGTIAAADLLGEHGFANEAVSRLYYYLLYLVRALLLTKGLEPRSHEGALRLFAQHFVKDGTFTPESGHVFSKLMKYREEADYNPSYSFSVDDFQAFRREAEALAERIRDYIRSAITEKPQG
jgi:uncharacterized protein (UPF0332 family)